MSWKLGVYWQVAANCHPEFPAPAKGRLPQCENDINVLNSFLCVLCEQQKIPRKGRKGFSRKARKDVISNKA